MGDEKIVEEDSLEASFFGFVKKINETDEKQPFFGLGEGECYSAESDRFRRTEKVGFPIPPNGEFFGFGPTDGGSFQIAFAEFFLKCNSLVWPPTAPAEKAMYRPRYQTSSLSCFLLHCFVGIFLSLLAFLENNKSACRMARSFAPTNGWFATYLHTV